MNSTGVRTAPIFCGGSRGFTLVEVLVAGALLVTFVLGLVAVVSQGSLLNKRDMLERRAFQELEWVLENPVLSHHQYLVLFAAAPASGALADYPMNPATVRLDDRGTATVADDLPGTIRVQLARVQYTVGAVAPIPALRVVVTITWIDEGQNYSETLEKVITLVRG